MLPIIPLFCCADFGVHYNLSKNPATKLAAVENPAGTIIIGDTNTKNPDTGAIITNGTYLRTRDLIYSATVHNGGGNMGLLDGHAKWYSYGQLTASTPGIAEPWRFPPA